MIKKYKVNLGKDFSIMVNSGPGSFSSTRISLAVAKGVKISKKINLFDEIMNYSAFINIGGNASSLGPGKGKGSIKEE